MVGKRESRSKYCTQRDFRSESDVYERMINARRKKIQLFHMIYRRRMARDVSARIKGCHHLHCHNQRSHYHRNGNEQVALITTQLRQYEQRKQTTIASITIIAARLSESTTFLIIIRLTVCRKAHRYRILQIDQFPPIK